MSASSTTIDPITLQVIGGALHAIAEQMGNVLYRMSYSSIIRESQDLGAGLDHRLHLVGVRPGCFGGGLRAAQLGRGDHLHRFGDLLCTLDGFDPVPNFLQLSCHMGILSRVQR